MAEICYSYAAVLQKYATVVVERDSSLVFVSQIYYV